MHISYYAVFNKDEHGYWISFPDLTGCFSCGIDFEDAKRMAKEAMKLYLDGLEVEKIPLKSRAEDIVKGKGELVLIDIQMEVKDCKLISERTSEI